MSYQNNQERTAEYLSKFNREKVLKHLLEGVQFPVIFDVGANVGTSISEFNEWWPKSEIHAFEPQIECIDSLNKVASNLNFPTNRVFINNNAVGESSEQKIFYTHSISNGLSGFNRINLSSTDSIYLNEKLDSNVDLIQEYSGTINHERSVQIISLNDYCDLNDIKEIDLLKIDTQGYEPEVLSGLKSRLRSVKVVITELMLYDYYERSLNFSDLEKYLLPAGFKLYDISHIAKNPMNGRTDWVDVIYLNKDAIC